VPVRGRVLGVWLLAALVGVGGGLGVGYLGQPRAASGGTATPLPASSPSVPVDPPAPEPTYTEDIDYPPLEAGLTFRTLRMSNSQQTWKVPVPKGWVASDVDTGQPVPRTLWTSYDELRFRPADEPDEGGYSIRVKMINSRLTPAAMVAAKKVGLRELDLVTTLAETDESYKFTYRTSSGRLRYNYFRWFAVPGSSEATLEMSVVGRQVDVPGLDALYSAFASTLAPVTTP
jgi:hypothetical protein